MQKIILQNEPCMQNVLCIFDLVRTGTSIFPLPSVYLRVQVYTCMKGRHTKHKRKIAVKKYLHFALTVQCVSLLYVRKWCCKGDKHKLYSKLYSGVHNYFLCFVQILTYPQWRQRCLRCSARSDCELPSSLCMLRILSSV